MNPEPVARTTNLVDSIRANVPMFALLRGQKQPGEVENAIRQLADDQIGFVRVRNPLIAPLSLERVVLQITGDDAGEGPQGDLDRVRRALIARSTMQRQIVVVVEQADTLTTEALEFLHGLPGLSDPSVAPVQVALVGSSALDARLTDRRTYVIRDPAVAAPASVVAPPKAVPPETRPSAARTEVPRSAMLFAAGLALAGVGGVLFMTYVTLQPDTVPLDPTPAPTPAPISAPIVAQAPSPATAAEPARSVTAALPTSPIPQPVPPAVQPAAEPSPAPPADPPATLPPDLPPALPPAPSLAPSLASPQVSPVEPPIPAPPVPPSEQAAIDRARLYREFTAFLDSSGMGKRLSPAERAALLQEYLARRQAMSASSQAGQVAVPAEGQGRIPGEPRVLLFFAAGSEPDLAAAKQEAELLRDRVAGLDLQPVSAVPRSPTIRYEFAADRVAALALAETVQAPGGAWQIEDMTGSPKRPKPGTIEMWLPRR